MKKAKRIAGILLFTAIIIFTMTAAACGSKSSASDGSTSNSRNSGGTSNSNPLAGKWYVTQEHANAKYQNPIGINDDGTPKPGWILELTADGKLISAGSPIDGWTYTVAGNVMTVYFLGNLFEEKTYAINGNELELDNDIFYK